jgi:hypothetical protein
MSAEIEINLVGPYGLCGDHHRLLFAEPISAAAGIYLWTVRTAGGFIVEYVGQTGQSFAKRTKDHLIQTFGGNYCVCDAQAMREGRAEVAWPGLWRRGSRDRMPEFAERYVELAPVIQQYVQAIEVFVAPLDVGRRLRERVEGALAHSIWDLPAPGGSLLPRDVRYRRRQQDEAQMSVCVRCCEQIIGLPSRLEI